MVDEGDVTDLQLWPREDEAVLELPLSQSRSLRIHQIGHENADWGLNTCVWSATLGAIRATLDGNVRAPAEDAVVVDVGAGTGALGLALHFILGLQTIMTDLDVALPLLQKNCDENGACDILVSELRWGQALPGSVSEELGGARAAWIVAADVIYQPDLFEPLLQTVVALLAASSKSSKATIATQFRGPVQETFWEKAETSYGVKRNKVATYAVSRERAFEAWQIGEGSGIDTEETVDVIDVYDLSL